jgi:hypothetical protein
VRKVTALAEAVATVYRSALENPMFRRTRSQPKNCRLRASLFGSFASIPNWAGHHLRADE